MLSFKRNANDEMLFALSGERARPVWLLSTTEEVDRVEPRFNESGTKPVVSTRTAYCRDLSSLLEEVLALLKSAVARSEREETTTSERDNLAGNAVHASAAGTLTQFNAIVAGLSGAFASQVGSPTGRGLLATSVALHTIAAFVLCFALRPVSIRPGSQDKLLGDTVFFYRLGWRATLLALAVTLSASLWIGTDVLGLR